MQCIVDQIDHQMRVSWVSPGDEDLSVVLNVPLVDDGNQEHDMSVGMSSGSTVWFCSVLLL